MPCGCFTATTHDRQQTLSPVALDVLPHLELVHKHGRHGGRGTEDGAARDQDVDVLRAETCVCVISVGFDG